MSPYHLESRIEDALRIHCVLSSTAESDLHDPILCFSLQAPGVIRSGGTKLEGLGGFTVVRLEGILRKGSPLQFELGFEDPYFRLSNRAWHPQGPYLRHPDGTFPQISMDVDLGVKLTPPPPPRMPTDGLGLVPAPSVWQPATGSLFVESFKVVGGLQDAVQAIEGLCERRHLPALDGGRTTLRMEADTSLPDDGYRLDIKEGITLTAAERGGAINGLVSLVSLRTLHQGRLPKGSLIDAPRFEWRGFMLDCVREFYPPQAIEKLLDLMALMKLNRFHWHFADDEAFRLEVETAPEIWSESAYRGEGETLPGLFGGTPGPRGGSYSKQDVKRIVNHAKSLNIEVLPEIEVPAHALALTTIRPDLCDPDDSGSEASVQGYKRNVVNPARESTWEVLEPLAVEVAALFPFKHLHLGGDELPDNTWAGSPLVDAYKAEHGLKSHEDVQGQIMHRLASHITAEGVVPCAWQEAALGCTGGIQNDAILFSWTGSQPGWEAAAKGYRVVMCPAQHTYFDMAHTSDPDDWGANWAANYALDETINWEPEPENSDDLKGRIIGVEGTFWSEFTSDALQYEPMIAPRILGLATMAWSPKGRIQLDDLRAAASLYMSLFAEIGWTAHGGAIMKDTPVRPRKKPTP